MQNPPMGPTRELGTHPHPLLRGLCYALRPSKLCSSSPSSLFDDLPAFSCFYAAGVASPVHVPPWRCTDIPSPSFPPSILVFVVPLLPAGPLLGVSSLNPATGRDRAAGLARRYFLGLRPLAGYASLKLPDDAGDAGDAAALC